MNSISPVYRPSLWPAWRARLAALRLRISERRELAHLATLDDRLLRDVGVTRADLNMRR